MEKRGGEKKKSLGGMSGRIALGAEDRGNKKPWIIQSPKRARRGKML